MNPSSLARSGAFALLLLSACASAGPEAEPALDVTPPHNVPRNVIFMLGDGMGFAQVKAYRMYADDPSTELVEPLPMEAYQVGSVSTDSIRLNCSGDDCVRDPHGFTDSASSATAYATGQDTIVGHLSVTGSGENLPTVLERARTRGKSTGMVATSQVTHASPAAFGSHVLSRNDKHVIANQYFDRQWHEAPMVDVLLGGGLGDMRRGDRDLLPEFRAAGYEIALNRQELLKSSGDRLVGLFADEGLPRAWSRGNDIPSLAEMTETAVRTLNRNPEGFFLMVEGSQIDWGAHANSVVDVVGEMEDFIAAVRLVLDFAHKQGDTLVIITADHETGGMALGRDGIYRWNAEPLRGISHSTLWMMQEYLQGDEPLSTIVARNVPFELSESEIRALDAAKRKESSAKAALAALFNQRTHTGWSTSGHTGIDVPLYVFGPGSENFGGVMQNEAVGQVLWRVFLPEKP
jgi:alkaline phosphatase